MELVQPVKVEAREGYTIWLEYADGPAGELDLSHLVGSGFFKAWENKAFFRQVHITDYQAIAWSDEIDLCPDALYTELTSCTWEEMYPLTNSSSPRARELPLGFGAGRDD